MHNEFAKCEIKTSVFSGRKSQAGNYCSILSRHQCCGPSIPITCLLALNITSIDQWRANVATTHDRLAPRSVVNKYASRNFPSGSRTTTIRIGRNPSTSTSGHTAWYAKTRSIRVIP